jgi:hypothetical protein
LAFSICDLLILCRRLWVVCRRVPFLFCFFRRYSDHVLDAALMGGDIATMPYRVMEQLINHPLTDVGLARLLADGKKRS